MRLPLLAIAALTATSAAAAPSSIDRASEDVRSVHRATPTTRTTDGPSGPCYEIVVIEGEDGTPEIVVIEVPCSSAVGGAPVRWEGGGMFA